MCLRYPACQIATCAMGFLACAAALPEAVDAFAHAQASVAVQVCDRMLLAMKSLLLSRNSAMLLFISFC